MLLPGHYMKFNLASDNFTPVVTEYWSLKNNINYTAAIKSYDDIKSDVYRLLYNSVERRLIADVPFGAFLSGGIDSSAVVGLMSKISSVPVKTFSVTFDESEFSEAKYAEIIAKKFGTDHSEIRLSPDAFRDQIPMALKAMDHPSGDGPNTYLVSKVTKEAGVSMALSGLGGDELFAGYEVFTRSLYLRKLKYLSIIPKSLRSMGTGLYKSIRKHTRTEKIHELFSLSNFELRNTYPLSRKILSESELQSLLSITLENKTYIAKELDNEHLLSSVSIAEMETYMQNVLLRDTDQMSMASALEVRVPFMDYELVEYVLGIPDKFKIPHSPKKLLTDSLGDLLPDEVVNRPKMGFTFPWKEWMKNELRDFCESKLSSLAKRPYFNELAVKERWCRFLNDDQRISWSRIWYLVVLEDWLNENNIS